MDEVSPGHDDLSRIPSPSKRLWVGLCISLAILVGFAIYSIYEIRWLESYQVNVVQQNRKASLQLLRLQNDAYLLAISLRDMPLSEARYPISDWRAEFARLRDDMDHALLLEGQFAVNTPASEDKRVQLRTVLADFWRTADHIFLLAQQHQEGEARRLLQTELEPKRAIISETVSRLLILNDRAQANAAEKIADVYSTVKREILILIGVLFLLALGTGLSTLQANRRAFEKLQQLAERLQSQSEQLRKLSWKLIEVQEDTLRQVARDLHDEFGQILTAVGAMLSRASQHGLAKDSEFVQDVQHVKEIVDGALQNVRDTSQMFRPAVIDDFGLEQTLEWFGTQFSRQTGLRVHFEGQAGDGLLRGESAIHVYRIVQAALSNVARHSQAKEAWVSLHVEQGDLKLEIRDNGKGFNIEGELHRTAGEGIGLMGMQERAQHLNGTLDVRSSLGKGTVVTLRIPLGRSTLQPAVERAG
jgi:signal transduction histidine kinase